MPFFNPGQNTVNRWNIHRSKSSSPQFDVVRASTETPSSVSPTLGSRSVWCTAKNTCDPSARNQSHVGRVSFPLRAEMHGRGHITDSCFIAFITSKIC